MANLSYSLSKGQSDQPLDIAVGTNAPGAGDVELRINGSATGGAGGSGAITTKEVVLILNSFIRRLETQQGQADLGNI